MSGSGGTGKALGFLAVWFGSGLCPVAPGTAGTLAAVPLVLLTGGFGPVGKGLFLLVLVCVGVWSCEFYRLRSGMADPSEVVVDEVVGFYAAVVFWEPSWILMSTGFVLFRFFDILKPFPVRLAEKLPGGIGIVADDLAAGGYSALCLWGLHRAGFLS